MIQQSCLQGQSCQGEGSTEQAKAGEAHGDKGDGVGKCVCVEIYIPHVWSHPHGKSGGGLLLRGVEPLALTEAPWVPLWSA